MKDKNINENDCSYISSLNFIKNKNINNNSFKEIAGICMHNDIERRKSLFNEFRALQTLQALLN